MKIAIDCRLIGLSGIGTFIENILRYLVRDNRHFFLLIGDLEKLKTYSRLPNCKLLECTYKSFSPSELLKFPTAVVNSCDAFYTPNFNIPLGIKIPIYSTIHDVVFFDTPDFGSPLKKIIIKQYIKKALHVSQTVFTVSQFSKYRIQQLFHTDKKINVIYNGINWSLTDYKATTQPLQEHQGIVFLGNLKHHKGIQTLLEAYQKLRKNGYKKTLTIIGRFNFRTKDSNLIRQLQKSQSIVNFVNDADDTTVYRIISQSEVLVSPSLYEGFGIPPLEAMFLGTPVIISNIPVYQEIYHHFPVTFFKAGDTDDLYEKLANFIPKRIEVENLIRSHYDYQESARQILLEISVSR